LQTTRIHPGYPEIKKKKKKFEVKKIKSKKNTHLFTHSLVSEEGEAEREIKKKQDTPCAEMQRGVVKTVDFVLSALDGWIAREGVENTT
jgi:hypothetical protein